MEPWGTPGSRLAESDRNRNLRFRSLGSAELGLTWHGLAPSQMVKIKTVCVCSRVHVCLRACRVYTFVGKGGRKRTTEELAILLLCQAKNHAFFFGKLHGGGRGGLRWTHCVAAPLTSQHHTVPPVFLKRRANVTEVGRVSPRAMKGFCLS